MNDISEDALQRPHRFRRSLGRIAAYVCAYLAGIVVCIALTPAEIVLAGRFQVDVYPWFSLLGFFFFFVGYETDAIAYWSLGVAGLGVMALGVASFFAGRARFARLRPWLLAFPVGFIGALGAYYTVAASI